MPLWEPAKGYHKVPACVPMHSLDKEQKQKKKLLWNPPWTGT